ncbi:hypothetical protein IMCC3135_22720 [Granulosicoccus antarcticus IMCC3135]|uniref:Uncharacterized protein n=1 Tax=Granulosicoccus antarcticus IMCC3135 TaxID=1192854 RepID=A0A2Z2P454_9GAMM|nr:hypothetical protein IMCC3135_22720 [Granulosicoccus antarcticus IMCC3135]
MTFFLSTSIFTYVARQSEFRFLIAIFALLLFAGTLNFGMVWSILFDMDGQGLSVTIYSEKQLAVV